MSVITKSIYVLIGVAITLPLSVVLSAPELSYVVSEQEDSKKWTGEYFSDVSDPLFTINTYETVCRGYFIRQETDTEVQYIGYGDLANEYTYTERKEYTKDAIASSTPIFDINTNSTSGDGLGLQSSSTLDM